MDNKRIIIIGAIVVVAAVALGLMLTSSSEASNYSKIDIIGDTDIPENGTLNVKLTNDMGVALKDKTVKVTVTDSDGNVVFSQESQTQVNGVANVKLNDVKAGQYNVNVTFDGDNNYTGSSISSQIKITGDESYIEDNSTQENVTVDDTTQDTSSDQSQSSTTSSSSSSGSYSSSSYSSSSGSSSSSSNSYSYKDEDGNDIEPIIDENGKTTYDY